MAEGPFSGVTVIDLTHVLLGPFCTMILADLGARVIKVEHCGGGGDDPRHSPQFVGGMSIYFASVNRGKASIALEFDDSDGGKSGQGQHARRVPAMPPGAGIRRRRPAAPCRVRSARKVMHKGYL